ncbi:MAG: molecular chaperone HtpG [Bacteroidetes bacterium]|nr:MAG: molecular chaperone HtpG [Bacteroidota bacterium]
MPPKTQEKAETFEYRAEMKQLLHLIINSLYTHKEIFLRELISNASDALNKIQFKLLTDTNVLQPEADRRIDIRGDKNENTLTIIDAGIGMTKEDLVERIGTVASSGTVAFVEEMQESGKAIDAQMIGQFGVGFYSAFMVSDRVTIETRVSDVDSTGYRWSSDGGGSYTVEEIEKEDRGTSVILHLKEDETEFAETWRLKEVIRKYSNFVDFPIYVDDEQVNTVKALWHRKKDELKEAELNEFYKFISNDFKDPLGHLHLHLEGRVSFRSILFIPSRAPAGLLREDYEFGLHLYSSNIFIQDDCKSLLPDYLRFIRGVVDTEDLPLNVSREVTQNSPVMVKLQQIITGKVLGMLTEWALDDSEKYDSFFREFGTLFKTGLGSDFTNRDEIIELLRYETTATDAGKTASLSEYVDRMQTGQKEIFFLLGSDRTSSENSPNLEYFKSKDLEVLLLIEPVDVFTISSLTKYKDFEIKSIEKADLDIEAESDSDKDGLSEYEEKKLIERFKSVLGDRVEDVVSSKRLVDSAATLVVGKEGMDAQTERMMRMMDQNFTGSKKVLEINPRHALIQNLSVLRDSSRKDELIAHAILQLFEGALLLDGTLEKPVDFVARMTEIMEAATAEDSDSD